MSQNTIAWLIGLPLVASPIIYLIGRFTRRSGEDGQAWTFARWAALIASLAGWIPLVNAYLAVQAGETIGIDIGMVSLKVDGLSLLLAGVVLLLTTFVVAVSGPYLDGEDGDEKY